MESWPSGRRQWLAKPSSLQREHRFESYTLRHINTNMLKYIVLFLITVLAGCSTQPIPRPAPVCDMTVAGKCHDMSAGEKNGIVTRGHGEEIKDTK